MSRFPAASLFALCVLLLSTTARAQPLVDPFDVVLPPLDQTPSDWLPATPRDAAGAHGFVRVGEDGHLEFEDGTPVRFVGASIWYTSCFPDSATAVAMAARLKKFGFNLVHFMYFDYYNWNASSVLAAGNDTKSLDSAQMDRLDWFIYQLGKNGIYTHFVPLARYGPRRDDGIVGWDSMYSYGRFVRLFDPQLRQLHQEFLTRFFHHVNRYTELPYADDPRIALVTITEQNSPYYNWVYNYWNERPGILSYNQSRQLDTMFDRFLAGRYDGTDALREAYWEGQRTVGPNLTANGGFESYDDEWTLIVGEGGQANLAVVQGPDVAPGEGSNSLRLAIRKTDGYYARIFLQQTGIPLTFHGIYRFTFKAKTDAVGGRQMRTYMFRTSPSSTFVGLDTTVTLGTSWQTYTLTFRSTVEDSTSTVLRFYMGQSLGDVFLDGIRIQATGREGLGPNERLENFTVSRPLFAEMPYVAYQRMIDLTSFYDSLGRDYYGSMRTHLRSIGVKVPLAATNLTMGSADTWIEADQDFTSEITNWDYNRVRPGEANTDSTWVIWNYSLLSYNYQLVPYFARAAVKGKPFIAEGADIVYPNAQRPELMLFYPAYASLQDWDGVYLYAYDYYGSTYADRTYQYPGDFWTFCADPSMMALMPQVSAMLRNHWIAPAQRTVGIRYDEADLRSFPITGYSSSIFNVDGVLNNTMPMVDRVQIDSFDASRHYTAADYFYTVPEDANIQSDTREITRDVTKGLMTVDAPRVQGGTGFLANTSTLRTSNLSVSWLDGTPDVTYIWTPLDTLPLAESRRSLLTISTRALNRGAVYRFNDSSLGNQWGGEVTQMGGVKLGVNFDTDADTVRLLPLDSTGNPTGETIEAIPVTGGTMRVTIDLAKEGTPWFGVEQIFNAPDTVLSVDRAERIRTTVSQITPNPVRDEAAVWIDVPTGRPEVSAEIVDGMGRVVARVAPHRAEPGRRELTLPVARLLSGAYVCRITVGGASFTRRLAVIR